MLGNMGDHRCHSERGLKNSETSFSRKKQNVSFGRRMGVVVDKKKNSERRKGVWEEFSLLGVRERREGERMGLTSVSQEI